MSVLFGFKALQSPHPATPLSLFAWLAHTGKIGGALSPTRTCFLYPLPKDGNVTRARDLHNAQIFMKIRMRKRECCVERVVWAGLMHGSN